MDYKRGREGNLISFENSFIVSFKPYRIMFVRKSNHNEEQMMKIEDDIKNILGQFSVENTIFVRNRNFKISEVVICIMIQFKLQIRL